MVYDWDPHKDVLYRLYIQERKHLETEIIPYMRDTFAFNPSKRAYQTQFKRWAFPSKQNPIHRNLDLVARVKQLWEQNSSQRDMLSVLNEEGYDVKERELMRLRAKHRWLLRVPNGMKTEGRVDEDMPQFQQDLGVENVVEHVESLAATGGGAGLATHITAAIPSAPPEEVARKRKERQDELQAWSDERWAAKKRRRRTRGYAGMGADPPGPPRFPSETTLCESQQFLSLDNDGYRRIRDHFQIICEENSIIKKTLAGPEKWQAAKDRLIQEDAHLQHVFWTDTINLETKALALDVICLDVTKRMRTSDRTMTIAEAKNALGVNPEQGRQIRNSFYSILKANHFTSKTEAGKELWQSMKQQWIDATPFLQEALVPTDPKHALKSKALDVLCRDVMKRLRDDVVKLSTDSAGEGREPADTIASNVTPARTPAKSTGGQSTTQPKNSPSAFSFNPRNGKMTLRTPALVDPTLPPDVQPTDHVSNLQIDPTLLEGADILPPYPPLPSPVAVYIRPHPKSDVYQSTKMWLGTLTTRTLSELHNLLAAKWSDGGIVRIDGVEKGANGQEISYLIEEDEELDAYLDHVEGRKAVFVVMLKKS